MKQRFWLFIGIIALLVIIIVAAVASQPRNTRTTAGLAVVTVNGEIGIDAIRITNMNTGTSINRTAVDLPFSFNCSKGDTLQVTVSTVQDYAFNSWFFDNIGTFNHHNPLLVKIEGNLYMTALCQIDIQPTPTPTETPEI